MPRNLVSLDGQLEFDLSRHNFALICWAVMCGMGFGVWLVDFAHEVDGDRMVAGGLAVWCQHAVMQRSNCHCAILHPYVYNGIPSAMMSAVNHG